MLILIEAQFGSLYRMDFKTFVKLIKDFIKGGPLIWQKFAFAAYNFSANGKICEHDMFQILEQFRQRDVMYFYKEMFNNKGIQNDYREACDDSDKIFFEAFNNDFSMISELFKDRQNEIKKKSTIQIGSANQSPFKNNNHDKSNKISILPDKTFITSRLKDD